MEFIDKISNILNIQKEDVLNNSKKIDDYLTYYWNPIRGGLSIIVGKNGEYLAAGSSVSFDELLKMFKSGEKNKNFLDN